MKFDVSVSLGVQRVVGAGVGIGVVDEVVELEVGDKIVSINI